MVAQLCMGDKTHSQLVDLISFNEKTLMMQCSSTWFACSWKFDVDNVFYQVLAKKILLICSLIKPFCYIPRLSLNKTVWLVDSWSHAPDQIQMYPDRDTIAQLLPMRRIQQHVFAIWSFRESLNIYNKALNVWSLEKLVSFVFPRVLVFPKTKLRETSGLSEKHSNCFSRVHTLSV